MDSVLDPIVARNFAIALLIGALVGIEREKKKSEPGNIGIGGLRTFILFAQAGAIAAWLSQHFGTPWIFVATVTVAGIAVIVGYVLTARNNPASLGLTTELAAISVCLLGGAAMAGFPEVAVSLAIVTSAILAFKQPLHSVVERLAAEDIYAGLKLLIASFIVLPLLPDRTVDAWGALNPYSLWLLVILISGLSLVGYIAMRWLGAARGTVITGLAGGLVSSTAVTLAFAKRSREEFTAAHATAALTAGVLLAWTIMFLRIVVEVMIVNARLLPDIMPAMLALAILTGGVAAFFYHRRSDPDDLVAPPGDSVPLKNPFSLTEAGKFALFFAAVLLVIKAMQNYAPTGGLYFVAALAGLTDVDAITLSMAQYAADTGESNTAATAITIAALSNTLVKCVIALALGSPRMRGQILAAALIMFVGGAAALSLL
jgi:uncharacterized membrane protein (DUF4010 family)